MAEPWKMPFKAYNTQQAPARLIADKPVLVFLHYFGGAAESWKWVAALLADRYHCVLLDLPGFGNAPAIEHPSIAAFASYVEKQLVEMGVGEYSLVGHSMGGKIAVQLAINDRDQENVKHLILVAPSPPSIERMPPEEQQRMLIHPNKVQAETTVRNSTVKPLDAEKFELAVATQLVASEISWQWWIREGIRHSIADEAVQIGIPVTVIASSEDPAVTSRMTEEDTLPNLPVHTKLITTSGCGHLFPLEVPEWLGSSITGVLQGS